MESVLDVERQETRLHALLLDPYAGSRDGLRALLEAEGSLVEAAADAPHAVALMRAGGFDLAVIDLGLSAARWIARSAWEPARLFRVFNPSAPVVLLAAELRRDLEAEAACVCPALVLEKPINPAHLRGVVRQLYSRTRVPRPGLPLIYSALASPLEASVSGRGEGGACVHA